MSYYSASITYNFNEKEIDEQSEPWCLSALVVQKNNTS